MSTRGTVYVYPGTVRQGSEYAKLHGIPKADVVTTAQLRRGALRGRLDRAVLVPAPDDAAAHWKVEHEHSLRHVEMHNAIAGTS